jgi:hypothetical protein
MNQLVERGHGVESSTSRPHHHPIPLPIVFKCLNDDMYHRERILETSTLSCNEEEEEITKPPKR